MTSDDMSGNNSADISLLMECMEDELSPSQISAYNKSKNDFNDAIKKIKSLVNKSNGIIISETDTTVLISVPGNVGHQTQQPVNVTCSNTPIIGSGLLDSKIVPSSVTNLPTASNRKPSTTTPFLTLQSTQVAQAPGGIVTTSGVQQGGAFQLVMDPVLGLVASPVARVSIANKTPAIQSKPVQNQNIPNATLSGPRLATVRTGKQAGQLLVALNPGTSSSNTYGILNHTPVSISSQNFQLKQPTLLTVPSGLDSNVNVQQLNISQSNKTNEVLNRLDQDPNTSLADSREINFNNLSGKTYPSLVVVARPHLKLKEYSQADINEERKVFNDKIKNILMLSPTKFTEWLIQQGLVKSDQYCDIHRTQNFSPIKLKLGMYSDLNKFPDSGGYVWITDCCRPRKFVSVYTGSIFNTDWINPPSVLKLIYHWCSQTNVQNVIQWVKVEKIQLKTFYTYLRAVCTATIYEKYEKLGGANKTIEVGVISLGTTSADGNMRQVKVEVLGIMDRERKLIRLQAVEPIQVAGKNVRKRFNKILEPLVQWIHKDSIILTDITVDKQALISLGFNRIHQVTVQDPNSKNYHLSNGHVMEYLRRVVPRMFQNTLSLLSIQIIQQFLDELVWRERWGYLPSLAFDSIITNLAEQTRLDSGGTLVYCLSKISLNPFLNWKYTNWKTNLANNFASNTVAVYVPTTIVTTPVSNINKIVTNSALNANNVTSQVSNINNLVTPQVSNGNNIVTIPVSNDNNIVTSELSYTDSTKLNYESPNKKQTEEPANLPQSKKPVTLPARPVSNSVSLESYYYGNISGNQEILQNQKRYHLNMKCCLCRCVLNTNINMMKHLIGHALNEGGYTAKVRKLLQCRYCLSYFDSELNLEKHVKESHFKTSNLMCLICAEKFNDRTLLILHMHRTHTELELPYECGICGFRTSEHRVVIDHFYGSHCESEQVQCPFCLKIVAFANNGRKISQNLHFFLRHMQRHARKSVATKCNKCVLWFVHKGILKEHLLKDHLSFKDKEGIECYRYSDSGPDVVLMPKPLASSSVDDKESILSINESTESSNYTINKFSSISVSETPDASKCCECEGDFSEEHFIGSLMCKKCKFSTCCSKAMNEHIVIFHDSNAKGFNIGKTIVLDKPMGCICGFVSKSGNKLAKHIAICGKKSVYPVTEEPHSSFLVKSNNFDKSSKRDLLKIKVRVSKENTASFSENKHFEPLRDKVTSSSELIVPRVTLKIKRSSIIEKKRKKKTKK